MPIQTGNLGIGSTIGERFELLAEAARDALRDAVARLDLAAARITSEELRSSYLERVPENRRIRALAAAAEVQER